MNAYLLCMKAAAGCDYSIDCGTQALEITAESPREAFEQARKIVIGDYEDKDDYPGYHNERTLETAVLYELGNAVALPVDQWYKDHARWLESKEAFDVEAYERAEYERLKAKFQSS